MIGHRVAPEKIRRDVPQPACTQAGFPPFSETKR